MTYWPEVHTKYEINACTQLKEGPGTFNELIIHIKGKSKVWRIWDAVGATGDTTPGTGSIIWAAQFDNPRVQEACIVDLDWPFIVGCYLEVPPGGVCTATWT